jgi:hypothetical protein
MYAVVAFVHYHISEFGVILAIILDLLDRHYPACTGLREPGGGRARGAALPPSASPARRGGHTAAAVVTWTGEAPTCAWSVTIFPA